MSEQEVVFNGIDGSTGAYLQTSRSTAELAAAIRNEQENLDDEDDVKIRSSSAEAHFGTGYGVDAEDLAEAGWGVIFAEGTSTDVVEALMPLLNLRKEQAGERFRNYLGNSAPGQKETKRQWLARHKMGAGPANPTKVPYYLLLVGDPKVLPYQFQYQLDVQYAVGRISFDTADEFARYAQSVVDAERGERAHARSKTIALFGPKNHADRATQLSADQLIAPLKTDLSQYRDWTVEASIGEEATKDRLASLLADSDGPSVLFTAGHGMAFPNTDVRHRNAQGALLCQDWPGPLRWGKKPISEEFYLAGADVPPGVRPEIVFAFACFGAGTPHRNDFPHLGGSHDETTPFVARLPERLLAAPTMSTLAFVGHVERAWGCSFTSADVGEQREPFTDCLGAIMGGQRVGHALESFNQRYADLSTELTHRTYQTDHYGERFPDSELVGLWTANNDARSYVVIGDPAVRAPSAIDSDN